MRMMVDLDDDQHEKLLIRCISSPLCHPDSSLPLHLVTAPHRISLWASMQQMFCLYSTISAPHHQPSRLVSFGVLQCSLFSNAHQSSPIDSDLTSSFFKIWHWMRSSRDGSQATGIICEDRVWNTTTPCFHIPGYGHPPLTVRWKIFCAMDEGGSSSLDAKISIVSVTSSSDLHSNMDSNGRLKTESD